eukprot:2466423-Alexandrium_andersonii.AAC.1
MAATATVLAARATAAIVAAALVAIPTLSTATVTVAAAAAVAAWRGTEAEQRGRRRRRRRRQMESTAQPAATEPRSEFHLMRLVSVVTATVPTRAVAAAVEQTMAASRSAVVARAAVAMLQNACRLRTPPRLRPLP